MSFHIHAYISFLIVTRTVRDIDNDKTRRFLYSGFLSDSPSTLRLTPPVECNDAEKWRLPSPSGQKVALLRQENNDETQVLEIWHNQCLKQRIRLPQQHGKVITDPGGFGRPSWNRQETCLVYSAERKPPETASFFQDEDNEKTKINDKESAVRGGQNVLGLGKMEHWGEKYSQYAPLLDVYCLHVDTGKVARVENVPGDVEATTTLGGFSLGQPVFTPDGDTIVYVGWNSGGDSGMPRRLGLIYCQQRPSKIYSSSVRKLVNRISSFEVEDNEKTLPSDDDFTVLTPTLRLARSPRISPVRHDGTFSLVFLGCEQGFETHSGCWALYAMKLEENGFSSPRIVIDQVLDPRTSPSDIGVVAGLKFPGLYLLELPNNCFVSSDSILLTSQWGSVTKVIQVSLAEENSLSLVKLADEEETSSTSLLCVTPSGGAIFAKQSSNCPSTLHIFPPGAIATAAQGELHYREMLTLPPIAATRFSALRCEKRDFQVSLQTQEAPKVAGVSFDLPIQSILLLPATSGATKPPLIVVPHGGPHSVSATTYLPGYAFLCGHGGYAILLVNYRGSTGFGQSSIESLPSNIGTLDVADMIAATETMRSSGLIDPDRIGICGGSHGGFLSAHCTSKYPDLFKAAVLRNPVVNIPSMTTATDIPDWCFVEACGSHDWNDYRPPTEAELLAMRSKSPICKIAKVKAPTLVAIGLKDLRVPASQGLEWYHTLRSRGIPSELLVYDNDDHALAGVRTESDHWLNIKRWFDKYL